MNVEIREFSNKDYPAALALWQETEGIGISDADSLENIERYLRRNPGMSFVATVEGKLVGTLLGGHDGRRGYLHHLVVAAAWRHQRIGKGLVEASLAVLKEQGIQKCHLFVFKCNFQALAFWNSMNWEQRDDITIMSQDLTCAGRDCAC
jgi:N-acetylglutamate synthase